MTRPATCEPYTYIARSDERHPHLKVGWKCQCGVESKRANHPTRKAAIDDWATNHRGET